MSTDTTPAPNQNPAQYVIPPDPHAEEQAEFADDLARITAEIENEFRPESDPEFDFTPEELGDTDPAPEDPAAPAPKDDTDPAVAKGLDRLVAREVALKVREDAAAQIEARAQAALAEMKKYEGMKRTEEIQALMDFNPMAAVKALGKDPMDTVRLLLAQTIEAQGKPVPPELQEINRAAADKRRKAEVDSRIADMERKLAEKDAVLAQQNYFNSVQAEGRQYVSKVGDSTPTVKAVASANPDLVFTEIMEEIGKDAQAKAARDPNAPLMTFDEAAKRIEDRWSKLKGAIAPVSAAGTDPNKNAPGAKKIVPPQIKPPAKPIAPWMQRSQDDLEQQGLREAMREFQRVEQATRRR